MIQIDDAGWGCLVGGVAIACYRVETGEFVAGIVPPAYFQDDDPEEPDRFACRRYLDAAAQVAATCLARLTVTPAEPIAICSGYVLDGVRAWLTAQGYRWQADKITGPLQELVERAFQAHLAELGFNVGFDRQTDHTKAGLFWWRQVQWLKGGNVNAEVPDPDRVQVCKTGWSTYHTWVYHPYAEARALAGRAKRARLTNHQLVGGN